MIATERPRIRIVVAAAVVTAVVAGLLAYHVATRFLSRRIAIAESSTAVPAPPLARRALILVIDGLRHDVALEGPLLPIAGELAAAGASGVSIAEDPTMTGAGVRALGTGTPPAFGDIVSNKHMPAVRHPHLFSALAGAGHTIAVIGDHTWTDLFGDAIAIQEVKTGLPPVMALMQPVYKQDQVFFERALAVLRSRRSTVTLVHLIGSDAVSHSQGPHSPAYAKKLDVLDGQLRALIDACGPDCLVVLTSDHGASDRGHHGLGEEVARRTPLVLTGPGVRAGVTFEARQRDVTPTLATLLGAPIPAPAQGRVLVEALALTPDAAARVVLANAERLRTYASAYRDQFGADLQLPDLAPARAALAAGDPDAARVAAERATTEVLARLNDAEVSRSRRLMLWLPMLILLALGVAIACVPAGPRTSRPQLAVALLTLAAVEGAFVLWRLSNTRLRRELLASETLQATPVHFLPLVACVVGIGVALVVRRALRARVEQRLLVFVALVPIAALVDDLVLPAALATLAAATLTSRHRVAGVVAAIGIALVASARAWPRGWSSVPPWLLVTAAGIGLLALARWHLARLVEGVVPRWIVVTVGIAVAVSAGLQLAGLPRWPVRLYGLAAVATLVASVGVPLAAAHRRALVGWIASALLCVASTPGQLPALIGGLTAITALTALPALRRGPAAALVIALLVVAGRFVVFHALEGRFSYSQVEWRVARLGLPESRSIGHALVAIKLALPLIALGGLVGATVHTVDLRRGLAWTTSFFLLYLAHCLGSLLLTAGQYHTPFVDLSALLYVAAFVGSVALAWIWLGGEGRLDQNLSRAPIRADSGA